MLESLDQRRSPDVSDDGSVWPGVADPEVLRAQLLDWLAQYANVGTRRTYAYALGLPIAWIDPAATPRRAGPPAAPPGPLHDLAWFRWCARRGRTAAGATPMITTRHGGRCSRVDLYTLLRRIAAHAGPALDGVADRVHPHALRHAYVTIALEQNARIQHVQADVGHATIATTQHYDRGRRTRTSTAADLVAAAIAAAPDPG